MKGLNQRTPKGSERPIVNHTPFPSSLRIYTIFPRFYHPGGSSRAELCTGPWKSFRLIIAFPAQIRNKLPGAWAAPFFPMMLAPRQTSGNGRDVLRCRGQHNSDVIWLWLFPRSWWPHVAAVSCSRVALGFKKSCKRFLLKVSSWMAVRWRRSAVERKCWHMQGSSAPSCLRLSQSPRSASLAPPASIPEVQWEACPPCPQITGNHQFYPIILL